MKQRNYSIDLMKFYFALVIAVSHTPFPSTLPYIEGGYIVVLFFLLSGYFLVCSFDSGKYTDPWKFTMSRLKRIWPYYAVAFLLMYLYMSRGAGLRTLVLEFCRSLPELFMLHCTGFLEGGINYPMWQLCTLIIVSHIFFALLQWNRDTTLNVICPVTALVTYTYYSNITPETAIPFVYSPIIRAAGAVAMGMFLHRPIRLAVEKLETSKIPHMPILVSCASIFLMLLLWTNRMDYDIVIPYTALLVCLLYSKSIWAVLLRSPILRHLDTLALGIYLNHALIVRIFEDHPEIWGSIPFLPDDIVFLLAVLVYTVIMMKLVDIFMAFGKGLAKKYMSADRKGIKI
ncbi:MAG: acyltransferase [Oscillospiraceae bacterium]|nr:acyltransferase [Oscillospiraceae bacterium]